MFLPKFSELKISAKIPKKYLILAGSFFVLLIIVFFASFFGLPGRLLGTILRNSRSPNPQLITNNQQPTTSTPAIDWKNIHVPEPGETLPDKKTAVPRYTYNTNNGGKVRAFDMTADQNLFSPEEIIVYQSDILWLSFTAVDKSYDLTIPALGNSLIIPAGYTKVIELQTTIPGQFSFICKSCPSSKNIGAKEPTGLLLVKPVT